LVPCCYFIALAVVSPLLGQPEEEPTLPVLSLDEAVSTAIESNLGLRVERLNARIGEAGVAIAEAAFDPYLFGTARYQSTTEASGEESDQRAYSAGVSKRVVTGAEVTAATSLSRNEGTRYSPDLNQFVGGTASRDADISLSVTQPLLRGFGIDVTMAELRRAESLDRATRLELQRVILDILRDTELAYWSVADAFARRQLRESSRELAQQLLEETRERAELGLATRLEVLQAEANLATREQEIIAAEQLLAERTDALLALLGGLDDQRAIDQLVEVARVPDSPVRIPEFSHVWRTTLLRNPETAIQEELILRSELETLSARDAHRPQFDVTVSGGYSGLSEESGSEAYREALRRNGYDWGGRIAFNYPFGRHASRAALRQAEYRREQAELALIDLKQTLLQATRTAWRDLDVARRQLNAAAITVRLQEATYEQERSRYEEGLATTRDVLEAQRDLDTARASLLDARYNALAAEIRLERQQGLLLERHQLEWAAIAPETLTP